MKILKTIFGTAVAMLALSTTAYAVPTLQIDVTDGTYDTVLEDLVCPDATCEVLALLTPRAQQGNETDAEYAAYLSDLLGGTYYLAIALTPKTDTAGDYGSIDVDGTTIDVTADMTYGLPPLAGIDGGGGDLGSHGIYETYFTEISFQFVSTDQCGTYNSADDPGGCDTSGTGTYYVAFDIDATLLDEDFGLHFDLYNTQARSGTDVGIDDFAPFSHDGRCCGDNEVPEPGTLALLGIGLLGLGLTRRRQIKI